MRSRRSFDPAFPAGSQPANRLGRQSERDIGTFFGSKRRAASSNRFSRQRTTANSARVAAFGYLSIIWYPSSFASLWKPLRCSRDTAEEMMLALHTGMLGSTNAQA